MEAKMKPGIYLTAEEILKLKTKLPPIKKILREIQDYRIRDFTEEALKKVPDQWWIDPCSIRMASMLELRKFHNPITLTNPGGIINHSIFAARLALDALQRRRSFRINIKKIPFQIPKSEWKDVAISTALLHDICKNGSPEKWEKRMHPEHGQLAVELLSQLLSFKKLNSFQKKNIINGIKWHMGNFIRGSHPGRPFTEFEKVIQEADFYSTRIFLTGADIQFINYPPKARD